MYKLHIPIDNDFVDLLGDPKINAMKSFIKALLLPVLLLVNSGSVFGHTVQTFWEITNTGKIRFWLEHWHNDVSPSLLPNFYIIVSQQYVGYNTGNYSVGATGFVNNTAFASLPVTGTVNNRVQCSGSANTYNDWVYYDFSPAACNQSVSVTFVDGPPAETAPACLGLFGYTVSHLFNDQAGPVITAPNLNVGVNSGCTYVNGSSFFPSLTVQDVCDPSPSVVYKVGGVNGTVIDPATYVFPIGSTTVTVIATDATGVPSPNTSTANFNVNVTDGAPPVAITKPVSVTLNSQGTATITTVDVDNGSYDVCSSPVSFSLNQSTFTCSDAPSKSVTLTVTDASGNSATANAVVTINYASPSFTSPANISTTTNVGSCTVTGLNLGTPVITGQCATVTNNAPAQFPVGTTTVTWTLNQPNGTVTTATQQVQVQAWTPVISYTPTYELYYSNEAITPKSITANGTMTFSISPSLPAGLVLNTSTGQISGTATSGTPRTTYTVTGTTACGSTTTTSVDIEVLECSGLNVNDFLLRGNASTIGSGASTEFQLTPATNAQFGAVWNKTRLNLSNDFDISSQVYLGNSDGGADGIAFVLQPLSTNQGSSGGGLGYAGISPSLSVEFDTYTNSEPTSADHIAMMVNGNTADHTFAGHHAVEMEDGQWRSVRFKWVAATKTFTVYLNGTQILQKANYDIVANIFNNNTNVYWGFTGATGGAVNVQKVKFDRYCLTLAANTVANVTTTTPIGTVTSTSAAIAGEVVNDGGASVTERGFVIGLATAPTTSGTKITDGTGVGPITGTFTGLLPATRYYARAYAVNSQGTAYGNEISFYTRPADITGVTSNNFNTTHQANVICYGGSTTLTGAGVSGTVYWNTGSCG